MSLAELITIPQLARRAGRPRRTLLRLLVRLHGRDRAVGGHPWLFRCGRPWFVNESALRLAHPELFKAPTVSELVFRVESLERSDQSTKHRINSLGMRVRRLESTVILGHLGPDPAVNR